MQAHDDDRVIETWQVRVHGRVQGIGYREACMSRTRALALGGWVRNRSDGSVELMLQGPVASLTRMREWLRDGVPLARVDALDVSPVARACPRYEQFERLPTL